MRCEYIILSCFCSLPPPLAIDCSALRVSHHTGAEQEKKPSTDRQKKTNSHNTCVGVRVHDALTSHRADQIPPPLSPACPAPPNFVFIFNFSLCYFKPCLRHNFHYSATPNTHFSTLLPCTVGPLFYLNTNCLKLILELISVSL